MSPKQSETSIAAKGLAGQIKAKIANNDCITFAYYSDKAVTLRILTWRHLTTEEKRFVSISLVSDGCLMVTISNFPKKQGKISVLTSLLRRAMLHIDDEKLYDEIMEAVHGK